MKYKTIGAFKSVQNIPYCKANVDLKAGMGVVLDRENKLAKLPTADEAKLISYIVTNIVDQPEIRNSNDFVVKKDEFVRADDLRTVNGLEIEFAANEITGGTTALVKNDLLGFDATGKLAKITDSTGYKTYFKVLEKTSYNDDGILAEISAQ